jgi:polyferredoxin
MGSKFKSKELRRMDSEPEWWWGKFRFYMTISILGLFLLLLSIRWVLEKIK